jgi:tetratricopeptide (TPR) repeat protein
MDSKVDQLLDAWEVDGCRASAEELCADCPGLVEEVRRCMGLLRRAERVLRPADDRPGTASAQQRFGEYELIRKLGEGGMGVVWEAEQASPRRSVALKVIRPGVASAGSLRRFTLEAEILGRLEHAGIARIYEAGTADAGFGAQPFFAMELVIGKSLLQYARDRQLDARGCLELFLRVCDAVQYAHQQGVIHRDLKPANILVDRTGRPRILDFGVARLTKMDPEATLEVNTGVGQLVGTVGYMSPEQAGGDPAGVDTRSDVYALGLILHELLAGHPPFSLAGKSLPQALSIIQTQSPPALGGIDARLRGDVETIALKALEKDRERRYAAVSDLSADVRRHLQGEPITARSYGALYQVSRLARRHKMAVGSLAAILIVCASAAVGMSVLYARSRRAELAAHRRYDDVRKLANTVLADVYDAVGKLPGSRRTREMIVNTSLRYLDELAREADSDDSVQRDLIWAYIRVADVQGNPNNSNSGDLDGALRGYTKALELSERLAGRGLADAKVDSFRVQAKCGIGDVLSAQGKPRDALAAYRDALAICGQWVERGPSNVEARRHLAGAYNSVAEALGQLGAWDEALAHYEKMLVVARQVASEMPDDVEARRALAVSHTRIGDVHMAMGRPLKGQGAYQQALRIQEGFWTGAAASAAPAQARRDLSVTYVKLGDVCLAPPQRLADAQRLYQQAYQIRQELAEGDADDAQARRDVAIVCDKLGDLAARNSAAAQAVDWYSKAVEGRQRLLGLQPGNPQWQRELWAAEGKLGVAYAAMAQGAPASSEDRRVAAQRALAHLRRGLEQVEAQRKSIGSSSTTTAELDAAVAQFTERIQVYQRTLGDGSNAP